MTWKPMETAPRDGAGFEVLLSNGSIVYAEYWDGPSDHPEWGGFAYCMTSSFCRGTLHGDIEADRVGWRREKIKEEFPE